LRKENTMASKVAEAIRHGLELFRLCSTRQSEALPEV
jgi:hypothetical protein